MASNILSFGKHSGKDLEEIPTGYLEWLIQQGWVEEQHEGLTEKIESELSYRTDHDAHFED